MEIHPPCHTKILSISLARINQCSEPTHSETTVPKWSKRTTPLGFSQPDDYVILPPTSWDVKLHGLRKAHLKIWIQIHSNSATYLERKKKRVFSSKQPPKKKKNLLESPRTKRFQRCKQLPCCATFKAWVFPNRDRLSRVRWIIGGNPDIWMKFHIGILGHGRADTSTFKSVQLVPAHVDNMFLDIKCFDHRNAVF